MSVDDVLKVSERLCERGLLRCVDIDDGTPKYELTTAGWMALLRLETQAQRG
jgi:hypothetical protein